MLRTRKKYQTLAIAHWAHVLIRLPQVSPTTPLCLQPQQSIAVSKSGNKGALKKTNITAAQRIAVVHWP